MLNGRVRDRDAVKAPAAMPFLPARLTTRTTTQAPLLVLVRVDPDLRSPSEDGGREELRELAANCAFNSTISALNTTTSRRKLLIARPPRNIPCIRHPAQTSLHTSRILPNPNRRE